MPPSDLSQMSLEDLMALRTQLQTQRSDLQGRIVAKSRELGVDPALSLSVAHIESLFDPQATSPTGVKGLFQVTVPTGERYGQTAQNRTDPDVSIHAGVSELKRLLDASGGNVRQALKGYGDPQQGNYADLVLAHYPRYAQMAAPAQPPSLSQMSMEELLRLRDQLRGAQPQAPPAVDTAPLPEVVPSPDPSQPATLRYPGAETLPVEPTQPSVTGGARTFFEQPAEMVIDIEKQAPRAPGEAPSISPEMEEMLQRPGEEAKRMAAPALGATIGGLLYGVPGAMLGGGAGYGFNVLTGLEQPSWLGLGLNVGAPLVAPVLQGMGRGVARFSSAGRAVRQAEQATAEELAAYTERYRAQRTAAQEAAAEGTAADKAAMQRWAARRQEQDLEFARKAEQRVAEHQANMRAWQEQEAIKLQRYADAVVEKQTAYGQAQLDAEAAYRAGTPDAYRTAVVQARRLQEEFRQARAVHTRATQQHEAALQRAQALPERYAPPTDSQTLYGQLEREHADTPIHVTPAQEMADTVQGQIERSLPGQQPTRMQKVVTDMLEWPEEVPFADVQQALRDLRPLTLSTNGTIRGIAKQLRNGLYQTLEASANAFPEASGARNQLLQANRAFRQEAAVQDLRQIVRTGGSVVNYKQGRLTLNPDALLNQVERHIADDPYFAGSVDLGALRDDLQSFVGTPARPRGPVPLPPSVRVPETTLETLRPPADVPLPSVTPAPSLQLPERPVGAPPPAPTAEPYQRVPFEPPPPVEPALSWPALGTRLGIGGGAVVALSSIPGIGAAVKVAGTVLAVDAIVSKALLSPTYRPLLLRSLGPRGEIHPETLGKLALAMQMVRPSEHERQPVPTRRGQ